MNTYRFYIINILNPNNKNIVTTSAEDIMQATRKAVYALETNHEIIKIEKVEGD